MIQPYKHRKIDFTKPVFCYRNLHRKDNGFSIKQNKQVIAHGYNFALNNVEFVVSKAGQTKVRNTFIRNIHAYAKGFLILETKNIKRGRHIVYNPYVHEGFMIEDEKVLTLNKVLFTNAGIFDCE